MSYELALYDDVYKWSYAPAKKVKIFGLTGQKYLLPTIENHQRMVRSQIKQAERFIMDDSFVRMSYDVCMQLEKVPLWINLSRLPYKVVWLEYDQWVRVEHGHHIGVMRHPLDKDLTARRGGWLLRELDEETGMFVAMRWEGNEGTAYLSNQMWIIAPEGSAIARIQPPEGLQTPLQVWPEMAQNGITAKHLEAYSMGVDAVDEILQRHPIGAIENRVISVVNPLAVSAISIADKYGERTEVRDKTFFSFKLCLQEDRGLIRQLIATLALLNEAPNVRHIVKPGQGHRQMGMHKLPYLGHSTVTLTLPKTKPVVSLTTMLDRASADRRRNRAHMARGHWRNIEYGKRMPYRCDHNPTLVEKGVGICAKCERLIRWIPAHQRGDAALGWVTHDYVLEGK